MENLSNINNNLIDISEEFSGSEIDEFEYNNNENYIDYYINKYTSEEFKKAKKNYLEIKLFKEKVESLKNDKDNLKKLFENIVDNNYYEIATFLIEKTDVDISELFDLFVEKNPSEFQNKIEKLLQSTEENEIKVGWNILLTCIEENKNLKLIENLLNNTEIKVRLYELYESKYINKFPKSINFLINKALTMDNKKVLINDLVVNVIENNNLELFKKLLDKEEIINNIDFDNIIESVFINKNIDIINVLLKNKTDLKLGSLKEEYKLFLLEYFYKNDFPEELKDRVISEMFKEEYIFKNVNSFSSNTAYSGQGAKQINLDKIFKYDKQTKKIIEIDKGYSNYKSIKNELLYEIEYSEEGERKIIYYERGSDGAKKLVTATIKKNNEIVFDTGSINYDLKIFQNKVDEILEAEYTSIDFFDYPLSYLTYAPLQLQQNKNNKDNIIFIADCDNIETIKNIINNSLEKDEYKNKTIICDFGYNNHNAQIVVCNGKVTIINTLDDDIYGDNWFVAEKIKARFNEEIDVKEISILKQQGFDCVEASKLCTISLAMHFSNDFKNFLKLNERLNKLKNLAEKTNELTEEEYELTKEEKDKKQMDYINENLTDEEYREHFKLLMTISDSNRQLVGKSQHFICLQEKFRKFRNNFVKAKCEIKLSEDDKDFIDNICNNTYSSYREDCKNYSYEEHIIFFYINKLYTTINEANYSYTNPNNGKNYEINEKMQFFLISIKLGNIEHIDNYMKELKEYVGNNKKLIKENLKNIVETNFRDENNIYIKEIVNRFNKEIEKTDLKIKKHKKIKKDFVEFSNNKVELENKKLIKIENNEDNKKVVEYINKLVEVYNNKYSEFQLKSINLEFISESLEKDKKYTYIEEEEFNELVDKLELNKKDKSNSLNFD